MEFKQKEKLAMLRSLDRRLYKLQALPSSNKDNILSIIDEISLIESQLSHTDLINRQISLARDYIKILKKDLDVEKDAQKAKSIEEEIININVQIKNMKTKIRPNIAIDIIKNQKTTKNQQALSILMKSTARK